MSNSALGLFVLLLMFPSLASAQEEADDENVNWATTIEFPLEELAEPIFNGRNLRNWRYLKGYWEVIDGEIVGKNDAPLGNSTYLLTRSEYRDFRLVFEAKQNRERGFSRMHSGLALLGERYTENGDPNGFKGPLLMFCGDWGMWDLHRRNRVYPSRHKGRWFHGAERFGKWNRIEVLVIGNRIRMVNNGKLVLDFRDQPTLLKSSPLGLQLHKNQQKQEFHFRGLILSRNPLDRLLTLEEEDEKEEKPDPKKTSENQPQ